MSFCDYELERLRRIEENKRRLSELNIGKYTDTLAPKKEVKKRIKKPKTTNLPPIQREHRSIQPRGQYKEDSDSGSDTNIDNKKMTSVKRERETDVLPKRLAQYKDNIEDFLVKELGLQASSTVLFERALNIVNGKNLDGGIVDEPLTVYRMVTWKQEHVMDILMRGWTQSQLHCYEEWRDNWDNNGGLPKKVENDFPVGSSCCSCCSH
jgi:hypothetical protein